jgi:hypothetical protein
MANALLRRDTAAELSVTFDGPAVEHGFMSVEDLAPALLSIARAAQRANEIVNPSTRLDVKVAAEMKRGSFHIDLTLATQALAPLLPFVTDAKTIAEWVFGGDLSVLGIWRRLRGADPKTISTENTSTGDISLVIPGDNNAVTINKHVWQIVRDPAEQAALHNMSVPLYKPGID